MQGFTNPNNNYDWKISEMVGGYNVTFEDTPTLKIVKKIHYKEKKLLENFTLHYIKKLLI